MRHLVFCVAVISFCVACIEGHYNVYRPPPPPPPPPMPPQGQCGISLSNINCQDFQAYPQKVNQYYVYQHGDVYGANTTTYREDPSANIDVRGGPKKQPVPPQDPTAGDAYPGSTRSGIKAADYVVVENEAKQWTHPWQAAIIDITDSSFVCSATLISDTAVVTAASCAVTRNVGQLRVRMGQVNIKSTFDSPDPVYEGSVGAIAVHPRYDASTGTYNAAVLYLNPAVDFTIYPNIHPICLPRNDYRPSMRGCTVAGWHSAPDKLLTETLLNPSYSPDTYNREGQDPSATSPPPTTTYSGSTTPTGTTTPSTDSTTASTGPTTAYSGPSTTPLPGQDGMGLRKGETTSGSTPSSGYSFYRQTYSRVLQDACVQLVEKDQCSMPSYTENMGYPPNSGYGSNPAYPSNPSYPPNPAYPPNPSYPPNPAYPSNPSYPPNPQMNYGNSYSSGNGYNSGYEHQLCAISLGIGKACMADLGSGVACPHEEQQQQQPPPPQTNRYRRQAQDQSYVAPVYPPQMGSPPYGSPPQSYDAGLTPPPSGYPNPPQSGYPTPPASGYSTPPPPGYTPLPLAGYPSEGGYTTPPPPGYTTTPSGYSTTPSGYSTTPGYTPSSYYSSTPPSYSSPYGTPFRTQYPAISSFPVSRLEVNYFWSPKKCYYLAAIVIYEPQCSVYGEEPAVLLDVRSILDFLTSASQRRV